MSERVCVCVRVINRNNFHSSLFFIVSFSRPLKSLVVHKPTGCPDANVVTAYMQVAFLSDFAPWGFCREYSGAKH